MINYRIKDYYKMYGSKMIIKYIPQRKFLFWWLNFHNILDGVIEFDSLIEAEEYIDNYLCCKQYDTIKKYYI